MPRKQSELQRTLTKRVKSDRVKEYPIPKVDNEPIKVDSKTLIFKRVKL